MKFTLDYYKERGKWYSSAEIEVEAEYFGEGVSKIAELHKESKLPGLSSGGGSFHVVAYDQESGLTHLFLSEHAP